MKSFIIAALGATASATDLKLTWTDCGDADTKVKINSFKPDTLTLGQKATMTGTGQLSEDVTGADFDLKMTGAIGTLVSCQGDASVSKTCNLPLAGSLTFDAMKFPIKTGTASVSVDISLAAGLPGSLLTTTTNVHATAKNGDKLFCITIKSAKAEGDLKEEDDEHEQAFSDYIIKFHKTYATEAERAQKFENFKVTYDYIKSENSQDNKYKLAVNEFSDLSQDEFAKTYFGYKMPEKPWGGLKKLGTHVYNGEPLADSVNWVNKGAVTPVKNQGHCGSCWSFSTTGSLEGANEIATGKLVSLSEEMLVDCSKQNHGCGGGSMDLAFQYVETNGLCTEGSYPYSSGGGHAGTCKASSCTKGLAAGAVTGFHDVTANSEQALMSAVQKNPVSIAVEADKPVFQSYHSGVMTGMCGAQLDHGILVVGYGSESGTDYWLVKNSWGTVWGEQGYGKLERGKGRSGECGILMAATYPEVSGMQEITV